MSTCAFCGKVVPKRRKMKPWPSSEYCTERCRTEHAEAVASGEWNVWDTIFRVGAAIGAKVAQEFERRIRERAGHTTDGPVPFSTVPPDVRSACLEVLGLPRTTTLAEAEREYRRLARLYHPDRSDGGDVEKMKKLNGAIAKLREVERAAS